MTRDGRLFGNLGRVCDWDGAAWIPSARADQELFSTTNADPAISPRLQTRSLLDLVDAKRKELTLKTKGRC